MADGNDGAALFRNSVISNPFLYFKFNNAMHTLVRIFKSTKLFDHILCLLWARKQSFAGNRFEATKMFRTGTARLVLKPLITTSVGE